MCLAFSEPPSWLCPLANRGDLIALDTKLPFVMKPLAYMQASNHLWNQNVFGSAEALLFSAYYCLGTLIIWLAYTTGDHVPPKSELQALYVQNSCAFADSGLLLGGTVERVTRFTHPIRLGSVAP